MLVLSRSDVAALLDLDELVEAVAAAMVDLSAGRASMPPRVAATVDDGFGLLAAMPAFLPSRGALTTKLVTMFPENTDRPTHQALICCFDPATGTPVAVMDGTHVTATRTAAGSALATRLLARPDSSVVAVIGTGLQARTHAAALAALPAVERILVAGRDPMRAEATVRELSRSGLAADIEAAASIEEAVRSADIVCAATHAEHPIVHRAWLTPGTHVNSVGYNPAGDGELDVPTIADAIVVVESRETALAPPPAGVLELHRAIAQGVVTADHISAELGELAAGTASGRTADDQLTVYKSVGVAVQDAAAAAVVLRAALDRGVGQELSI